MILTHTFSIPFTRGLLILLNYPLNQSCNHKKNLINQQNLSSQNFGRGVIFNQEEGWKTTHHLEERHQHQQQGGAEEGRPQEGRSGQEGWAA